MENKNKLHSYSYCDISMKDYQIKDILVHKVEFKNTYSEE